MSRQCLGSYREVLYLPIMICFNLSKAFSCSSCNLIVSSKDPHISSFPLPSAAWDKYAIKDAGWVK